MIQGHVSFYRRVLVEAFYHLAGWGVCFEAVDFEIGVEGTSYRRK